jgi:hypothetical protein
MLGLGAVAFVYCGNRALIDVAPPGASLEEALRFYEGSRWEVGRWAGALVAAVSVLFLLLPRRG